jgi:hypothetical protein
MYDCVVVSNGRCDGRSSHQTLVNGRVTITGKDEEDKTFARVIEVEAGEIMDNRLRVDGRLVHRVLYGKFETTLTPAGREITRFRKDTLTGRHGKSRSYEELFGHAGCCHSWFKQGRLVRQKIIYTNGVLAYDWRGNSKPCAIRNPDGASRYRITGAVNGRKQWAGSSVFSRRMDGWFLETHPFSVEGNGRVIFAGQYDHGQRVGKWVLDGKDHYYEHGVAIPKKLFETPPEKLDPSKLLRIDNAQLRMAMLAKANFDAERLAKIGRVVHRDGAMRLFDIPNLDTRILRVQCPSTKSFYFIRVPKDSIRCETARQWTFHVHAGVAAPIKFTKET